MAQRPPESQRGGMGTGAPCSGPAPQALPGAPPEGTPAAAWATMSPAALLPSPAEGALALPPLPNT